MKLKNISTQFIMNYIFLCTVIIFLVVIIFFLNSTYEESISDEYFIDLYQFEDDYKEVGLTRAMAIQNFGSNDFTLVLDKDRTVIDSSNTKFPKGYIFKEDELQKIIYSDEFDKYYVYHSDVDDNLYVLYNDLIKQDYTYLFTLIGIIIIIFIVITGIYVRYSANQIINPLAQLVLGVQNISKGNFNTKFEFESSNELNILKNEIEHMSETIQKETSKRKHIEENRKKLLTDISHDIRTPLTNILGYADKLLRDDNFVSDDQKQNIEIISHYGENASKLISELFDLSSLEVESYEVEKEDLDLVELIRLKLIDYLNEFEQRNIKYDINLPDKPVYMKLNRIKFERVIDNLINNSIKYNNKNFQIFVTLIDSDNHCKIIIKDVGIGIPASLSEQVFEPMFRVENSRNPQLGGSGLGLSIAKQIVKKHNGNISLDNNYKEGCLFEIKLDK